MRTVCVIHDVKSSTKTGVPGLMCFNMGFKDSGQMCYGMPKVSGSN